ncbi:MAG: PA14 domain-containing protein [Reyranellaceae bacterium]
MSFLRIAALALIGLALATSPSLAQIRGSKSSGPVAINPANPQPAADKIKPGLSVSYYFGLINNVNEIPDAPGKAGPPLPQLNYNVGFKNVLTSDREDGVQAIIIGYIMLDKPGLWKFAVQSNDGCRFLLDGKKIYELPGVQPDVMSDVLEVNASAPGWYALKMFYFEKRNTSTLELYWAPPGVADLAIVPASAFAHVQ